MRDTKGGRQEDSRGSIVSRAKPYTKTGRDVKHFERVFTKLSDAELLKELEEFQDDEMVPLHVAVEETIDWLKEMNEELENTDGKDDDLYGSGQEG